MENAAHLDGNNLLVWGINGMAMFLDDRDRSQMPGLLLNRKKDEELTLFIKGLAGLTKPGSVIVEIGATFGYYTLLVAKHFAQSRIFSFEPHPKSFALLKNSVELNGFDRFCKVYPVAIGALPAPGQLAIHRKRFELATLCDQARRSYGLTDTHPINILSLDEVMRMNRSYPDVLLVSAEGYEPQIWAGMKSLLAERRPMTVILDCRPGWYSNPEQFLAGILDNGFEITTVAGVRVGKLTKETLVLRR